MRVNQTLLADKQTKVTRYQSVYGCMYVISVPTPYYGGADIPITLSRSMCVCL